MKLFICLMLLAFNGASWIGAPWHSGCGGGVPWGAAMNIIPWEHYLHYGDISVLQEHYFAMTEQLRHMQGWILPDGTMHQQKTSPQGGDPVYYLTWANGYLLTRSRTTISSIPGTSGAVRHTPPLLQRPWEGRRTAPGLRPLPIPRRQPSIGSSTILPPAHTAQILDFCNS